MKDILKNKLIRIMKVLILFILFFSITSIFVSVFNIDINNISEKENVLYSFICNLIFVTIIVLTYLKSLKKDFKEFIKNFNTMFEESFKYYLLGLGIMLFSNLIITFFFSSLAENEQTVRTYIELSPALMFVEVSLLAPFSEELLFRKSIREVIKNKWLYIFASGFIFGGLHVIGTPGLLGILSLIPYCSLGFAFAYTYAKTNNIFSTISMHMLHNTATIILYFIGASL